jgi:hypothetical protein
MGGATRRAQVHLYGIGLAIVELSGVEHGLDDYRADGGPAVAVSCQMLLGCRRSGYEEGTAVAEQPNTVDVGPHPDGGKQYGLDRNRRKPVWPDWYAQQGCRFPPAILACLKE